MKRILIIGVVFAVGVSLALFFEGKLLLNKYRTPMGTNLSNLLLYSLKYNNCLLQNGKWSQIGEVCVVEYKDGGKVCSIGSECLSGKCLMGKNDALYYGQWSEMIYKKRGGVPNRSVGPEDEIIPNPPLPDNIKGMCLKTNLCDYRGYIILGENGVRRAEAVDCFNVPI